MAITAFVSSVDQLEAQLDPDALPSASPAALEAIVHVEWKREKTGLRQRKQQRNDIRQRNDANTIAKMTTQGTKSDS